jgi:hypothetical protein
VMMERLCRKEGGLFPRAFRPCLVSRCLEAGAEDRRKCAISTAVYTIDL